MPIVSLMWRMPSSTDQRRFAASHIMNGLAVVIVDLLKSHQDKNVLIRIAIVLDSGKLFRG